MEQVLLLSPLYEPMMTITWRKAVCLLTLGKVEIIEEYDRQVRSTSIIIRLPSVVRLIQRFRRQRKHVRYSKNNVFARDRWTCQYCGRRKSSGELTQDHVIPRSHGGKTCWENVVTCCIDCNTQKGNRTPEQARMTLRSRPYRPDWVPMFVMHLHKDAPEEWKVYCYLRE